MVERTRIGLIFSYDENWIGGAYYILNIIHALNTTPNNKKPHIVVLSSNKTNYEIVKKETNYPYLSYFHFPQKAKYSLLERIINKITRILFNKNVIVNQPIQPNISFLYPSEATSIQIKSLYKINWIPDFQEEFLPHFFSGEEINSRKQHQKDVICNGDLIVFSSKNAQHHFYELYPQSKVKTIVLPFAVSHPDYSRESIDVILKKYNLPKYYFFTPNQFWAHKNHIVILKAIKKLKERGKEITIAFSGKENDYRNKEHVSELKKFVSKNNLEENIRFLGFIERTEQLCLLKNSIAVIQPSLFEGWSTVVEDSKAIGKHIILSNIDVHQEQIKNAVTFFNPNDSDELASIIETLYRDKPELFNHKYDEEIKLFAESFLKIIYEYTP